MSNDDNNDNNNQQTAFLDLSEFATAMAQYLQELKVPEKIAREFACLRAHPTHPWGMMHIMINGERGFALVTPGEEEHSAFVWAVVLSTPSKFVIEDLLGNKMNEKNEIPYDPHAERTVN